MNISHIREITQEAQERHRAQRAEEEARQHEAYLQREAAFQKRLTQTIPAEVEEAARQGKNKLVVATERERIADHFEKMGFETHIDSGVDWEGFTDHQVRLCW